VTRRLSFAGDVRAFLAACRKELLLIRRYPATLISMAFWPIALPGFTVLMGRAYSGGGDPQAVSAFAQRAGTADFAGFVFVGYVMYMWLSLLLWGAGTSLRQEQVRGSLEAVFLTPATRLVPLFAPPIAHLPWMVVELAVMGAAMRVLFEVSLSPDSVLRALVVVAVAVPVMYAIGSLFATAVLRIGETGPIVQLVRGLFSLACGITFPLVMLPAWAQTVAWTMPTTYVVNDVRAVLLRGAGLPALAFDLVFLVAAAAVVALVAVVAFRMVERSARETGMLGRY
jgi:ABC-2 type transport system permease protein